MFKQIKFRDLSTTADMSLMRWQYEDGRMAHRLAAYDAFVAMGADQMPFPNQVNVQPAPAVAGDFATTNPRATYTAGPGGLVAASTGVSVGRFAWVNMNSMDPDNAPATASNNFQGPGTATVASTTGAGPGYAPAGFVHREQQGLITTFLAESSMVVPAGFPVTLINAGDVWILNSGTGAVYPGMYAFANFSNGLAVFGTGGTIGTTSTSSGTLTGSIGPYVATFLASISGNLMTVASVATGTIQLGGTLSGGTGVLTGLSVISQVSGTVGGVGVYTVSVGEQSVAQALLTETMGLLTVSASAVTLGLGDLLTSTASGFVPCYITAFGTGAGGSGTYYVNASSTIALNSTLTATLNVQTKWIATTYAAASELVKISTWVTG
jgi:hypothetical protein